MGVRNALAAAVALLVAAVSQHVGTANALHMPTVVASNMVLQRAPQKARVWGFANATEGPVKVVLDSGTGGKAYTSEVVNGQWSVDLDPQPASAGHTITVTTQAGSATLQNIAFGDVFLCSGQASGACHGTGVYGRGGLPNGFCSSLLLGDGVPADGAFHPSASAG